MIALVQTYFAIQTRKQELSEKEYNELAEDEKRLYRRNQVRKGNYNLNKTAVNSGVNEIKNKLIDNEVYKRVKNKNKNELSTYYEVGRLLIEAQGGENRAKYGDNLIKDYSIKLTNEIGKKYNITTLKRMRQFYCLIEKGAPVVHQLTWPYYCESLWIFYKKSEKYAKVFCTMLKSADTVGKIIL